MNTIKIYLEESGTVADLRKDFNIYQGQYQSKLLNVYVPTSIVATKCNVKIGIKHLDRSGIIKQSRNFAMRYVKDVTYNGVDYALFERLLPKEFTMYVGTDQNKPRLIINVVDITDEADPTVLSVITCQECDLDVMLSANLYNDETLDPTALEEINAELNALNQEMAQKQDKTDILLETTNKTVVGAINENKESIYTNTTNIASNSEQIAGLRNDITDLTARIESGENDIGQMEGENLPTSAQLSQFVEDTVARATVVGDVVIFVLDSDPKRNYKFTYYQSGWAGYELTTVSKADNNIYGLLKGTYGIDSANEVLLDINNGEVLHIWVQDGATYRDLKEYLGANKTNIAEIKDGTQTVGKAVSAEEDGEGNNIVNTYLTQSAGATKEYVQDYAVPKQFSNVYFITAEGYDGLEGTNEDPIFTETTSSVGEHQIIKGNNVSSDLAMTLDADFEVSIANAYQNTFWLEASADCDVEFKLITQYQKEGQQWANLNIELSEQYSLTADTITRVDFSSQFLSLGDTTVELVEGDKIRQILSVKTQTSDSITFDIYSYSTYPSTFNLLVSNYTPMGATTVYVDGSPVASWNANNKTAVTSNGEIVQTFNADTKADVTNNNQEVTMGKLLLHGETGSGNDLIEGNGEVSWRPRTGGVYDLNKGSVLVQKQGVYGQNSAVKLTLQQTTAENEPNVVAVGVTDSGVGHLTYYPYEDNQTFNFKIEDDNGENGKFQFDAPLKTNDVLIANGKVQLNNGLTDGNNATYKAVLPDTTSWTANKVITMTDEVETYSTSEQAVGKWIDGSTIYRRVYDNIAFSNNSSWTNVTDVSSLNIQTCIRLNGVLALAEGTGDAGALYNVPTAEGGTYFRNLRLYNNYIQTINNGFVGSGFIVIEYTKNN